MTKKLIKEILSRAPHLKYVEGYFIDWVGEHLISGFALDGPRDRSYIWLFTHPLYDPGDGLKLTFGERLPSPSDFIEIARGREGEAAAEILLRTGAHADAMRKATSLMGFQAFLWGLGADMGARPGGALANPWCRRAFASTLIMREQYADALDHLRTLMGAGSGARIPGFLDVVKELVGHLDVGDGARARAILIRSETEERQRLNIRCEG